MGADRRTRDERSGTAPYRFDVTTHRQQRGLDGPGPGASIALPLAIGVLQVVGTYFAGHDQLGRRPYDALAALLLAAGPAALFFRRRYPAMVLVFVLATTAVYWLLDYPRGPVFLALVAAFLSVVIAGRRLVAAVCGIAGYATFVWGGYLLRDGRPPSLAQAVAVGAWLLVLLTMGEAIRGRRERMSEAARTRAEEARRRASEERLRIARELHDVLAHNISLINVQAGVALHLIDDRPEQARTALAAIKDASNEALGELRSVLDILRQGGEEPPRAPAPGLAEIDDLVSRTKAAGLDVRTRVEGTPRDLPSGVDLAAFRIVQEALTNVTRHAGRAHAEVTVAYGERELVVQIDDDGRGATETTAPMGTGSGIAGMRERVAALGGDLEAGPLPSGGFRVRARLPYDGREATQR